jgi:hypothetical protein
MPMSSTSTIQDLHHFQQALAHPLATAARKLPIMTRAAVLYINCPLLHMTTPITLLPFAVALVQRAGGSHQLLSGELSSRPGQ